MHFFLKPYGYAPGFVRNRVKLHCAAILHKHIMQCLLLALNYTPKQIVGFTSCCRQVDCHANNFHLSELSKYKAIFTIYFDINGKVALLSLKN